MKNWKTAVGVAVSAVFLYLAFRSVHLGELARSFGRVDYRFVVPAMLLVLASLVLRAVRWRYLLLPVKSIGIPSLYYAIGIGSMVNIALPARLGEIVRAHAIGKKEEISRSAAFATIVLDRVFDGLALLFFLAIVAVFGRGYFQGWLANAGIVAIAGYCVALVVLVLLRTHTHVAVRWAEALLRPFPEAARTKLLAILRAFIEGLGIFRSSRNMVAAIVLSPVVWLPNVAVIALLLAATGIHLSALVSVLLLVALCVGVALPSAPGFIGNVQFVCVAVLKLFGVPAEQALTFSLIYTACMFVAILGNGLACVFAEGLSFAEIGSIISLKK
jgi:glycosyltransferase 2 family protein